MTTYNFKSLPEQYTFKIKKRTYKIFQLDLRSLQKMIRDTGVMSGQVQVPEYDLAYAVLARGTVDGVDLGKEGVFEKHFGRKIAEMNTLFALFFTKSIENEDEEDEEEGSPNE